MYCETLSLHVGQQRPWMAALAASVLSLLAPPPARSQAPPAEGLTLRDALARAREANPDLLAARSALDAARAQEQIAAQWSNPTLTFTTEKISVDGTPAGTVLGNGFFDRNYDTTIAIGQPIELGGKRKNRRRSAREGIAAAEARLADSERLVTAAVVKAYAAALVARDNARLTRESADSFRRTAELAAVREQAGDISASERAQVEIAAGRFQADAASAEVAFRSAVRALESLLNLRSTEEGTPLADDLTTLAPVSLAAGPRPTDEEVLSRRPDLAALEANVRKAEADLALAKGFRVPDPTILAQYERQPPDQSNTVGVGVSLPLPVLNRNAGGIRAAETELFAARRELDVARVKVRAELVGNRAAVAAAQARVERFRGELLPKAEQVRSSVEFAYSKGAASLLELLEAVRNSNDIRLAASAAAGDLIASRADLAASQAVADAERGTP